MLGNSDEQAMEHRERNRLHEVINRFGDYYCRRFRGFVTLKTIMAYEWVTCYCRQAQFVVKTDDDVVVNPFALTKVLQSLTAADVASSNIWCKVHQNESTTFFLITHSPDFKVNYLRLWQIIINNN